MTTKVKETVGAVTSSVRAVGIILIGVFAAVEASELVGGRQTFVERAAPAAPITAVEIEQQECETRDWEVAIWHQPFASNSAAEPQDPIRRRRSW
jgi:hypothetical protein